MAMEEIFYQRRGGGKDSGSDKEGKGIFGIVLETVSFTSLLWEGGEGGNPCKSEGDDYDSMKEKSKKKKKKNKKKKKKIQSSLGEF